MMVINTLINLYTFMSSCNRGKKLFLINSWQTEGQDFNFYYLINSSLLTQTFIIMLALLLPSLIIIVDDISGLHLWIIIQS